MTNSITSKSMAIISAVIFVFLMFIIYKPKRAVSKEVIKFNSNYSATITIIMIGVASLSSLIMYYFSPDTTTGFIVFVLVFYFFPYALLSSEKRKYSERIFKNIIIYVNNSIVTVRQEKNVYKTLLRISEDIEDPLKEDVLKLVDALEEDSETARKVFRTFEAKYNYTIIKQLDALFLKMHYEDSSIREEVLNTLSKDVYQLSNDIEDNKSKRTMLRFEYLFISLACLFIYFLMIGRFANSSLFDGMESKLQVINILFIVSILVSLFFVDQYFNSHLLKE